MVFSSIQAYLDSSNWQQPPSYQTTGSAAASGGGGGAHLLSPRPQSLSPQLQSHSQSQPSNGTGPAGSIRPGSMADRARMANIPMPEAALKCPRCESTNTKFCYFNNYSLTQPRHFCKNCRRYWTRGGALRNVPVGGGCRRNRRTKSNNNTNNNGGSSNNTSMTAAAAGGPNSTVGGIISSNYGGGGHHESILSQILSPVRLMSPAFNHLNDLATADKTASTAAAAGLLNYGVVSGVSQDLSSIHLGSSLSGAALGGGGGGSLLSCLEQWRPSQPLSLPQLPALGGGSLEDSSNSSGFYPFEAKTDESGYVRPQRLSYSISSALATQLASVKVEDNPYKWGNNGTFSSWTDLSSFGSSG